jgi:hypothetical protein
LTNNSAPPGSSSWFQGNTTAFTSQSGDPDSYIAANFLNADVGGNISNWLITPALILDNSVIVTFYTRTTDAPIAADSLQVRLSTNGAGSNVGTTDTSVGDFTALLLTINPTLNPSGYPTAWTQFMVTLSGLASPTTGRLAFRYAVPDTSVNGEYIGIDSLSVTSTVIPEPSSGHLLLLGFTGILAACEIRRRGLAQR